eukprot:gene16980-8483_t
MSTHLAAVFWILFLISDSFKGKLAHGATYKTVLHGPRLHFSGTFISDVATVNNQIVNYDTESFLPHHSLSKFEGGNGGYNPLGTNYFMLKDVFVKKVCYENSRCTSEKAKDAVIGLPLQDGGLSSGAKMVDIDPLDLRWTEIWALKIKIPKFFETDSAVLTLRNLWERQINGNHTDHVFSGLFHGVLKNVEFLGSTERSSFLKQLKWVVQESKNKLLSIRFILDLFDEKSLGGRIYGTIGCQGDDSSTSSLSGRALLPRKSLYSEAVFTLDHANDVIVLDLGNSLPTGLDGNTLKEAGVSYYVAYAHQSNYTCKNAASSIKEDFELLGELPVTDKNWLTHDAGFVSIGIPRGKTELLMRRQFFILKVKWDGSKLTCDDIVLMERCDGIQLTPKANFVYRKESGDHLSIELIASSFGERQSGIPIELSLEAPKDTSVFSCCTPKFVLPVELTSGPGGIALATVKLPVLNAPRKIADGQLYRVLFSARNNCSETQQGTQHITETGSFSNTLILKVFDHVEHPLMITWVDHVYPIFKQYANLYPVMKSSTFDMSNFYSVVRFKNMIRTSLSLPTNHSNYMPVSRDLSPRKRRMVIDWLSQDRPKVGRIENLISIQRLRMLLQNAVELEHATIPPYLTALWSIRDGYNRQVYRIIKVIIRQEMLHMALAANVLNAVGGHPSLNHSTFIPQYPSNLPGGVEPDLIVPLEKLSPELIKNVFMRIEKPDTNLDNQRFRSKIFDHMKLLFLHKNCRNNVKTNCKENIEAKLKRASISCSKEVRAYLKRMKVTVLKDMENRNDYDADPKDFIRFRDSIASFYTHILFVFAYLTDCGKNDSIFTGNASLQLTTDGFRYGNGKLTKVNDYATAIYAIKTVIEEGEGTSGCDPSVHYFDAGDDFSHYSMFHTIIKKRRVSIKHRNSKLWRKYSNSSDYECQDTSYDFSGPRLRYIPGASWPIISNARQEDLSKGNLPWVQGHVFARLYNKLLGALHRSFNGEREYFKNAKFLMYSVDYYGRRLVQTPMDSRRSQYVGPNAAPVFRWTRNDNASGKSVRSGRLEPVKMNAKLRKMHVSLKGKVQLKHNVMKYRMRQKHTKYRKRIKSNLKMDRRTKTKHTSLEYGNLITLKDGPDLVDIIENSEDLIYKLSYGDSSVVKDPVLLDMDDNNGYEKNYDNADHDFEENNEDVDIYEMKKK